MPTRPWPSAVVGARREKIIAGEAKHEMTIDASNLIWTITNNNIVYYNTIYLAAAAAALFHSPPTTWGPSPLFIAIN